MTTMKTIKLLLLMLFMTTAIGLLSAQSVYDATPVYDKSINYEGNSNNIFDYGENNFLLNDIENHNGVVYKSTTETVQCPMCFPGTIQANGICDKCGYNYAANDIRIYNPIGSGLLVLIILSLLYIGWVNRKRLLKLVSIG